jgi:single-stranded-DNA-specific exonuclease
VLVHGDYDVDGICSTTIMTKTLSQFGAKPVPFIPRRIEDGYDLSARACAQLSRTKLRLCSRATVARARASR